LILFLSFRAILLILSISFRLNSRNLFKFLYGHCHKYCKDVFRSHFELLCSFVYLEFILLDGISNLILLIILLFFSLMTCLFLDRLNNTLFLEVSACQDCRNASLVETSSTNSQDVVNILRKMTNDLRITILCWLKLF
jgi:hypothetical protein